MKQKISIAILTFAALIFLNGCIKMGPDYKRPNTGIEKLKSFQHAPVDAVTLVPEDRWWEVFGDRELIQFVEEVIKNNWDIKQAAARVLEVRAQFVRVRADRFPAVDASGFRDRRLVGGGQSGCT